MQSYTLDPKDMPIKRLGAFCIFLLCLGFSVLVMFAMSWLWPSPDADLLGTLVQAVIIGIITAVLLVWRESRLITQPYKLTVTNEEMIVDSRLIPGIKRSVRKGEIIYIDEQKHGLVVSNYGPYLTGLLGCVWIPKNLPGYEHLKLLARNWTKSTMI